jgi:hypothetical protein
MDKAFQFENTGFAAYWMVNGDNQSWGVELKDYVNALILYTSWDSKILEAIDITLDYKEWEDAVEDLVCDRLQHSLEIINKRRQLTPLETIGFIKWFLEHWHTDYKLQKIEVIIPFRTHVEVLFENRTIRRAFTLSPSKLD